MEIAIKIQLLEAKWNISIGIINESLVASTILHCIKVSILFYTQNCGHSVSLKEQQIIFVAQTE